jgi:hypothetical protein
MRFMLIVKATDKSEAGTMPTEKELAEMAKFNEEMIKNGVMLAGDGLQPSSKGARVTFTETKELIGGFWLIQAKSKQQAVEWARRVPFVDGQIEVRQVFELEDFGTSEAVHQHTQNRDKLSKQ